ncbi:MAG: DNA repair protein RecO [Alphaproteobacteria bacterium]|nr:DNA repair protein RecO [Alphaproteobacteria bacterium]
MEWSDDGIVLLARKHGESSAIVSVLTAEHGRHAGLVRGGSGSRMRGVLEPGNRVRITWRARLEEQLGSFTQCGMVANVSAGLLDDPLRLAALQALCAVAEAALPERERHGAVYAGMLDLLGTLDSVAWAGGYVRWELALLADLGFGLDLSACAATGSNDNLTYVSPKSGRAVSASAGEPYRDRLLALPGFLIGEQRDPGVGDVAAGLALTGYFLDHHVLAPHGKALPLARGRLLDRLGR